MNVLVVGLGAIGQRHVRNLRAILGADVDICAYRVRRLRHVVTPTLDIDASVDVEAVYDVTVFDRLEDALAQRPAVALICNPSSMHVEVALACVRAGCDLFVEKPLASMMSGVPELLRAVESHSRVVMVGYQLRFNPCFASFETLVRQRSLGLLVAARAVVGEYLPGWHRYEDYRAMYAARADLGGGVILSQIHEFDYLYALFGLPRRVFTVGGHLSDLQVDVEDVASTVMEFDVDGRPLPVHLHQDYVQRPASRSCEIIGMQGRAVMDLSAVALTTFDATGAPPSVRHWQDWNRNDAYLAEMRHFLACVESRQNPVVSLSDGIASLRMALAARESLASGKVVELQPLSTGL